MLPTVEPPPDICDGWPSDIPAEEGHKPSFLPIPPITGGRALEIVYPNSAEHQNPPYLKLHNLELDNKSPFTLTTADAAWISPNVE